MAVMIKRELGKDDLEKGKDDLERGKDDLEKKEPLPKQNDAEDGAVRGLSKNFSFDDITIRHHFIQKVYSIIFFQLLFTFGFVALVLFVEPLRTFANKNAALGFLFGLAALIVQIALLCGPESWRRTFPINIALLSLFTLFEGILVGWIVAAYGTNDNDKMTVGIAFGLTMLIVVVVTIFAFQTKYDVTGMGGILCIMFLALIVLSIGWGIFAALIPPQTATFYGVNIVISSLFILLFIGLLLYETQLLIGGKHEQALSPEDYVLGAILIYLTIISLFLRLLALLGAAKQLAK